MKLLIVPILIAICLVLFSLNTYGQSKPDSSGMPVDTFKNKIIELKEVIIKATPIPVIMKGDTVSYNAKAFKTRVNSTVEDLLKKLPGLQVDEQGRITFQGKSIEKIYIDGKDYYLNDPKLITENLTADMIDRIDVFDQQSKQSILTGVKDVNPGKALNLKLKKGVKLDFTGKVNAGYGTRDGYAAGAKGSSFVKDRAITGTLGSNNINNLTEENQLPFSIYGRSSFDKGALQYSAPWGQKLRVNLEYNGGDQTVENKHSVSKRERLLADSTQLENQNSEGTGKYRNHSLGGTWELSVDSATTVNLQSSINFFTNEYNNKDTLQSVIMPASHNSYAGSSGSTNNLINSDQEGNSNAIRYDRRMKKRTLSFDLSQNGNHVNQEGSFNSILKIYAPDGSLLETNKTDQRFTHVDRHAEYATGFTDAEQLNPGNFLNTGYGYQQFNDQTDEKGFNYNPITRAYDLPDTLTTGSFKNSITKHQASLVYISSGRKVNYSLGIIFEHTLLANSDAYRSIKLNHGYNSILPSVSLDCNGSNNRRSWGYGADYSAGSEQPNPFELQAITDNRNPLQLITGNPDLEQAINHNLTLHYSRFNVKSMQNLNVEIKTNYQQHSIVTATEILAGGLQKVTYVNREGRYSLASHVTYELPIGQEKKGKLQFSLQSEYSRSPALLNDKEIVLRGFNSGQKIEFDYMINQLELHAEGRLSYQVSRYSEGTGLNSSGMIQNYKMNAAYNLPFNLLLKSDYSLQIIGAQGGLPASKIFVWNASLLKNVLKSGRGEFKLSAFDLLNSNKGFYQRIAAGFIQQTTSNVLGRLILVSFIYHIRSVPQGNAGG